MCKLEALERQVVCEGCLQKSRILLKVHVFQWNSWRTGAPQKMGNPRNLPEEWTLLSLAFTVHLVCTLLNLQCLTLLNILGNRSVTCKIITVMVWVEISLGWHRIRKPLKPGNTKQIRKNDKIPHSGLGPENTENIPKNYENCQKMAIFVFFCFFSVFLGPNPEWGIW